MSKLKGESKHSRPTVDGHRFTLNSHRSTAADFGVTHLKGASAIRSTEVHWRRLEPRASPSLLSCSRLAIPTIRGISN